MAIVRSIMKSTEGLDKARALTARVAGSLASRLAGLSRDLSQLQVRLGYRGFDDDIFIVSYPKSGTTWVQMILYQLTSDGAMDIPHIDMVSPHFEETVDPDKVVNYPRPRMFKSHLSYRRIPRTPGRYLYVLRDGKDVAVSYFHQLMTPSFEGYFSDFITGNVPYGSWFSHVSEWTENRDRLTVHVVRYEDLVNDLDASIRRIAEFCQIDVSGLDLSRVLRNCTFEAMRQHEAKFSLVGRYVAHHMAHHGSQPLMIRNGRVGSWRDNMTEAMLTRYYTAFERRLKDPIFNEYRRRWQ